MILYYFHSKAIVAQNSSQGNKTLAGSGKTNSAEGISQVFVLLAELPSKTVKLNNFVLYQQHSVVMKKQSTNKKIHFLNKIILLENI